MNQLPEVIQAFYQDRKANWQKKNITDKLDEFQKLEKLQECEAIFKHQNWVVDAANRISSRAMTTHPSKFSHPSTGVGKKNRTNGTYVSPIFFTGSYEADGLLRTGNVKTTLIDSVGNAAELDVEEFLRLEIENKTILDHIEADTDLAKQLLTVENQNYTDLKKLFLAIKSSDSEQTTSEKLKQIYYPVLNEKFNSNGMEYFLLSPLTNSSYLFEQRKRIDEIRFSEETKAARELKKQNKYSETGFRELYNVTTIGFGGTKPANISVLNNLNAGKAHLLESTPPDIKLREIRVPQKNFFTQTLRRYELINLFKSAHNIVINEKNNMHVRNEKDQLIQKFADYIIEKRWQVYMLLETQTIKLSDELPTYQKIWLLPEMKDTRDQNDLWLDDLINEASKSFFYWYGKTVSKDAFKFGDAEYLEIKKVIENNREDLR